MPGAPHVGTETAQVWDELHVSRRQALLSLAVVVGMKASTCVT